MDLDAREGRVRGLPPKLGIKKRKPRPAAVVDAANDRVWAAPPSSAKPGSQAHVSAPRARLPPSAGSRGLPPRAVGGAPQPGEELDAVKRKGLRHFAVRVSRKVEEKGVTTYNEVADELVIEEKEIKRDELEAGGKAAAALEKKLAKRGSLVDEKNIRRRVYDSLNVLMAMGIIEKEKKLISWKGLAMARSAGGSGEIATVRAAIDERRRLLEEKRVAHAEVAGQVARIDAIVARNREDALRRAGGVEELLASTAYERGDPLHRQYPDRLGIPFIIVSAPKDTNIELEMDQPREDVCFTFSSAFAIYDDREILRRMRKITPVQNGAGDLAEADRLGRQLLVTPSDSSSPIRTVQVHRP